MVNMFSESGRAASDLLPSAAREIIAAMAKPKTPASRRFYQLLETLFRELDQVQIRREVEALRQRYPKRSREELSRMLIRRAAIRTATVGAAAGSAGGPWALLAMAPDIFNLVRQQSQLVLSIAFLFDRKPSLEERFREVLAVLGASAGVSLTRQGARLLVKKGLEARAAQQIVRKVAGKFLSRRLPALAPGVGTVVGGTLNYLSVQAVGKAAMEYYSREAAGPERAKAAKKQPAGKKIRKKAKKAKKATKKAAAKVK